MLIEPFHPLLRSSLIEAQSRTAGIRAARRETLDLLAEWIASKARTDHVARLVFICTHNSRRSHFGQVWAQTAAQAFGLGHVRTFSGGTDATALHPNAVSALRDAGFEIRIEREDANPLYAVTAGPRLPELHLFSKRYDDAANPISGFAAVMTCSDADEACPFIPGAEVRFSTPYDDPKTADGTAAEAAVYSARSLQIASEMLYVMHLASDDSRDHELLNFLTP
jgi:arsenate reductase